MSTQTSLKLTAKHFANGMKAEYTYDAEGRIKGIGLRDGAGQLAKAVGYEWDKFGQLATRYLKGFELPKAAAIKVGTGSNLAHGLFVQKYRYDKIGRLVGVECPDAPELCESYVFDQSGNIVSKTIGGQTVEMTYDLANQLITKAEQGSNEATSFSYDAAGRMTGEAIKGVNVASYTYGYLDKVLSVNRQGRESARFSYDAGGMLVGKQKDGVNENWVWDGISLAAKGKEVFVNEAHASGGVPIMASKLGENGSDITADFLVNDYLGTTIASTSAESAGQVEGLLVASLGQGGEAANASQRFTGKPYDADLGAHVFPFRNYRTDIGRWMSSDPSGFPDGPNGHFYAPVATSGIDSLGLWAVRIKSGGDDTYTYTDAGGVRGILYRHVHIRADLVTQASSFLVMVETYAHSETGFINRFDFAGITNIGGNLTATTDGRVQLSLTGGSSQEVSSGIAQAAANLTYTYLNNQKEVEIVINYGGANLDDSSVSVGPGGSVNQGAGSYSYASGFQTLVFEVYE